MRSYALHQARAKLSTLIGRALKGEPQRVTRHGKEAVIIVSEDDWKERPKSAPTLADLFLKTVGQDPQGFSDVLGRKRMGKQKRTLGKDFTE